MYISSSNLAAVIYTVTLAMEISRITNELAVSMTSNDLSYTIGKVGY